MAAPAVAPGYTIHVAGLAPETTEEKLHDFFSFCGKLVAVKKTGSQAEITFEKLSAMRTSLMLNGGTLDGAHLEVTSASDADTKAPSVLPTSATGSTPVGAGLGEGIAQEDKPKAAIVAEYLAHGYVLGDQVIQRAIDFDHKQGISSRFLSFLESLDKGVGNRLVGGDKTVSGKIGEHTAAAIQKTKEVDQNRGISGRFHAYYSKAVSTSVGQKVQQFYTTTQKQIIDVHEEARRIADEKKVASVTATPTSSEPGAATDAKAPAAGYSTVPPTTGAGITPVPMPL